MKQPKAFFFDLDGTSYYHKYHDVMPSTLQAWKVLQKKGYRVAIATSRCLKEMENFRKEVRVFPFDAVISDGGALISERGKVIHRLPISRQSMHFLQEYCAEHEIVFRYSTQNGDYFSMPCAQEIKAVYFKLYLNVPQVKAYAQEDEVYNVLLYVPDEQARKDLMAGLADCAFTDHKSVLEVTDQKANKITGIEWLCAYWGMDMEETMAFGDGFNDVEMIKRAGIGVAMGNGEANCKEVADHVCDRIEQDGIAKLLKELEILADEAG